MELPKINFQFVDPTNNSRFSLHIGISVASKILQVKISAINAIDINLWTQPILIGYTVGAFTGLVIFEEEPENTALIREMLIGIPEKAFIKSEVTQKIPKKIYQVWLQAEKDELGELQVPEDMKPVIESWKKLNPDYEYELFNEEKIKTFLKDNFPPIYLQTYNLLLPRAFRADFWRYCILYKYGGVYSDSKMTLLKPLSQIIRSNDEFVICNDGGDLIAIAFMAFPPKHPLLEHVIYQIINNVTQRYKTDSPLGLTGPLLFGRIFKLYVGISGPISHGFTDQYQILKFTSKDGYFYDTNNVKIIKYLYETYKKNDNQEWNHYPTLWSNDILFDDKVTNPLLREIPFLRERPEWLIASGAVADPNSNNS